MSLLSFVRCVALLPAATLPPSLSAQTSSGAFSYSGVYFGRFENGGRWGAAVSPDDEGRFNMIGRAPNGFAIRTSPYPSTFYADGRFEGVTPANAAIAVSISEGAVIGAAAVTETGGVSAATVTEINLNLDALRPLWSAAIAAWKLYPASSAGAAPGALRRARVLCVEFPRCRDRVRDDHVSRQCGSRRVDHGGGASDAIMRRAGANARYARRERT